MMMKRPFQRPAKMKTQAISGEESAKIIDSPTKSIADERLAELGAPANNVRIIVLTEEAAAARAAVAAKPRFKPSSRHRGAWPKSLEIELKLELENYHPPPVSRAKAAMRQVSDVQDAEAKAVSVSVPGSHHRGQSRCLVVAQAAIFLGSLVTLVKLANGVSVDHCYSDIGCFPLSEEFYHPRHRPFNVRPWHRRLINTRFLLFNRQTANDKGGFQLEPWSRANLLSSRFNPLLETKIIIPGWLDSLERALWVKRLRDALLHLWQPINIIVVHWNNFTPYTIATANTRVVGAELANLLRSIETELNYDRAYYHLIGHSLGAHIAGYCGDRLAGLGRITALDPARPFFQHMPKSVRLDRGDAKFVDAIHSDFTPENAILLLLMSYGMSTPVGHVDFYPNGHAYLQPGCLRDTLLSVQRGILRGLEHASLELAFLEALRYLTACDHQRSHEWFLESVTNRQCTFVGVRCNEFEGLINGRCTCDDSPSACAIMGIHADQMYVHNLHEDIWPLGQRGSGRNRDPRNYPSGAAASDASRPSAAPATQQLQADSVGFFADEQIARPLLPAAAGVELFEQAIIQHDRAQIHQELLRAAASLRNQPPPMPPMGAASDDDDDAADEGLAAAGLDQLDQDTAFINYLRANFASQQQQQQQRRSLAPADIFEAPPPLVRPSLRTSALVEPANPNAEASNQLAATLDGSEDIRRMSAAEPNFRDDVELIFSGNNAHPMNKHPKLLSDLDRDIESWYEDSSRWFLKTNKRPNYCVNQYQILIYLGPLRSSRGRGQLRANLLVSIIGSRGKLINQRFIPRSTKLDSYTMQPFFVILEGAFSLGSILSVAVGWEASAEPDPIQATISFQSSLLEDVQASLPDPPRLRPYIGETIRFDHSDAFKWAQRRPLAAAKYARRRSSSSGSSSSSGAAKRSIARRSLRIEDEDNDDDEILRQQADEKCLVEDDETGQCTISHLDMMHETPTEARAKLMTGLLLEQNKQEATGQRADSERKPKVATSNGTASPVAAGAAGPTVIVAGATLQDDQFLREQNDETSQNDRELLVAEAAANLEATLEAQHHYELLSSQLLGAAELAVNPPRPSPAISHQRTMLHHFGLPLVRPAVPVMTHDEFLMQANENGITATLHNIDIVQDHLIRNNNNMDQDSIVINQIVVNPLQANYGKGLKQGKVFCPSRPSRRLRRDQTIRLLPNLLGRCPVHHHHHR